MKHVIVLFLALLLLTGCSSKKRVVAAKVLPTWYTQESKSNASTLYSVGEGEDKEQAIANALSAMASTLSVSISSEFNTKSVVRDGTISSMQTDSTNEIQSQVQKVRISNYQIVHAKEFGFQRYLVALSSNKERLFSSLNKEIMQKFDTVQSKFEDAQKYNMIKRLSIYKDAKEETADVKNTLLVMNSLKPRFNDKAYIDKLAEVENRYENLLSKITCSIDSNEQAINLMPSIANGLSLENYKIVKKANDNNHFKIRVVASITSARSYGFDLARSAISITVKDHQGTVIGSNKLNITGQSTQGYQIAKENVAVKLNAKILQEGIANIIGLEL